MSAAPDTIVARARSLIGTRFRPQGREPGVALDCVGLAAAAAGAPLEALSREYRLRGDHLTDIEDALKGLGFSRGHGVGAGDIVVCQAAASQLHLIVHTGAGFVHADAQLRRVVERRLPIPWPVLGAWRAKREGDEWPR